MITIDVTGVTYKKRSQAVAALRRGGATWLPEHRVWIAEDYRATGNLLTWGATITDGQPDDVATVDRY